MTKPDHLGISRVWTIFAVTIAAGFYLAEHTFGLVMSLNAQLVVIGVSMLIIGLAHGGVDHLVAKKMWIDYQTRRAEADKTNPLHRRFDRISVPVRLMCLFLLIYGVLSATVVLAWWQWPTVSLIVFLIISAYHFGDDFRLTKSAAKHHRQPIFSAIFSATVAFALGSAIIVLPWTFHSADVAVIFGWLSASPASAWTGELLHIAQVIAVGLALAAVGLAIGAQMHQLKTRLKNQYDGLDVMEAIAVVLLFSLAPPLVAFALFFSFLHATQHFAALARYFYPEGSAAEANNLASFGKAGDGPTLVPEEASIGEAAGKISTKPRWQAWGRVYVAALPLTLLAVVLALAVGFYIHDAGTIVFQPFIAQLIFITLAALTVPHMLLVIVWSKTLQHAQDQS